MRIVELQNGRFIVKRGWWIFAKCLDDGKYTSHQDVWWPVLFGFAGRQAMFDSYINAKEKMDAYIQRKKSREIKVLKVHKS